MTRHYEPYALKHKLDSSGYCAKCDITYTYDASRLTGHERKIGNMPEEAKVEAEIKVMQQIVDVLKSLDIKAQRRALRWVCERYEPFAEEEDE